jgi:pyruvate formate lyase activating enzyme
MTRYPDAVAPGQGRIFNIQRFSLQDGPGLRTTVFLKGCPLACAWCHNPESQSPHRELLTQETRCIACGACHEVAESTGPGVLDQMVELCPTGARQGLGRDLTVPALLAEVLRDRMFFDQSGGGVTFSGGEPLSQPDFTVAALGACRTQGLDTALDTSGLCPQEHLLAAAALADTVLYDVKHLDDARHREWTGVGNATILANLEALGVVHDRIWIRVPVVPGVNDDVDNLEATARFVARIPGVRRVDLLPYHSTGAAKLGRLGRATLLDRLHPPTPERMAEAARLFQAHGLTVTHGGTP